MIIAIEAQRIFRPNKHGMDFVALESIRHLQAIDKVNEYYIFVGSGADVCLSSTDNFKIVELNCPTYPLWEQVALPIAAAKVKADILHCTSNTAPIWGKTPLMVTLHDIIYLEPKSGKNGSLYQRMGWHYRRFVVPKILPKCRVIVTVSDFERNRIAERLGIDKSKIETVYNGYGSHFVPVESPQTVTAKYIDAKSYIFFLGNTDPKKNTARTLVAYSIYLKKSTAKLPLLIADIAPEQLLQLLTDNGVEHIRESVVVAGYIDNGDLPAIYSGAKMFLYPSLRESFGIPLLEAMACGTPVITSDTSAMPEIAGAGALVVNPIHCDEIATAMLALETDEALYKSQVQYGLERVKKFSWQQTASDLLSIYNTIDNRL